MFSKLNDQHHHPGHGNSCLFATDLPVEAKAYVDAAQFAATVTALNDIIHLRVRLMDKYGSHQMCCIFTACFCCCIGCIPFYCAMKSNIKARKRADADYWIILQKHNETYYNPRGVTLKVKNDTIITSGTSSVGIADGGHTVNHEVRTSKWYLIIEIETPIYASNPIITFAAPGYQEAEQSTVVNLKLMTTPPKEASIHISNAATFDDLLIDARAAFRLDSSLHVYAVDNANVMYSSKVNVTAALTKNRNTHVYITVDM